MKYVSSKTWNGNQSWNHETVFKDKKHTLRITIIRNAYDFQSRAKVERWNGERWHEVCHRPIESCSCRSISYVSKNVDDAAFHDDVVSLLAEAVTIVS